MAIKSEISLEKDYLFVKASGTDESMDELNNYLKKILEAALLHDMYSVLCDESELKYEIVTLDMLQLAEILADVVTKETRVAIVCHEKYLNKGKYFETVASNRGVTIKITEDIEEAKAWLTE